MKRARGIRVGRKLLRLWKWVLKRNRKPAGFTRLNPSENKTMTKICNWGRRLRSKLCPSRGTELSEYSRIDDAGVDSEKAAVPKGHLAVYVGQKDDDPHRYLVPVIYFNHPLFGQLLREAEEEYGYHHPGGITIPCPVSEFESVQMKIAAGESCRKLTKKRLFNLTSP